MRTISDDPTNKRFLYTENLVLVILYSGRVLRLKTERSKVRSGTRDEEGEVCHDKFEDEGPQWVSGTRR